MKIQEVWQKILNSIEYFLILPCFVLVKMMFESKDYNHIT